MRHFVAVLNPNAAKVAALINKYRKMYHTCRVSFAIAIREGNMVISAWSCLVSWSCFMKLHKDMVYGNMAEGMQAFVP